MAAVYILNSIGERKPPCGTPVLNWLGRMCDFDMLSRLCVPFCNLR